MNDSQSQGLLVAARIGGARGLKGEVSLEIRTDRPEESLEPGTIVQCTSKEHPRLTVASLVFYRDRVYAKFEGINSREAIEKLRGCELLVPPVEEEDAWYEHQLKGLAVVDTAGVSLGEVAAIVPGAAQDLLDVVTGEGAHVLVPMVYELMPEVDLDAGRVVLDPPGGLFDDQEA